MFIIVFSLNSLTMNKYRETLLNLDTKNLCSETPNSTEIKIIIMWQILIPKCHTLGCIK